MKRSYSLVLANFLAAIGGGIILTAGIEKVAARHSKETILAYFIGALIGFAFSKFMPEQRVKSVAPWFSINVGVVSLMIAILFKVYAVQESLTGVAEVFFIILLSIRFGLWFFSRALRSQLMGSEPHGIALIETGYYAGMVFGLLVWEITGYLMLTALLADVILQTLSGLLDLGLFGKRQSTQTVERRNNQPSVTGNDNKGVEETVFDYQLYRRAALAVVCLTVGFQAVFFSIAQWKLPGGNARILGCFYIGVALAALVCKVFKISLRWDSINRRLAGNATIGSEITKLKFRSSFCLMMLVAATSMVIVLLGIGLWKWTASGVLIFVTITAFVYQLPVISLLDQIGRAEKLSKLDGKILQTYLLVAVVTIISIGILSQFPNRHFVCMALTVACCAIAFSAVRKREIVPA